MKIFRLQKVIHYEKIIRILLKLSLFVFLSIVIFKPFFQPSPTKSIGGNKFGINLAGRWDLARVNDVRSIVGEGGWVVLLGTFSDIPRLQEVMEANVGLNIV